MLIAGGRTYAAPLAGHINHVNLSSFFRVADLKGTIRTKRYAETAAPAGVFIRQYRNNRLDNNRTFGQGNRSPGGRTQPLGNRLAYIGGKTRAATEKDAVSGKDQRTV